MQQQETHEKVYRHFLKSWGSKILSIKRCELCHKNFKTKEKDDRLCGNCKIYGAYLYSGIFHTDIPVRDSSYDR